MATENKFNNGFSLVGKVCKAKKVTESDAAVLTLEPVKDKFSLSSKAIELLGIVQEKQLDKDGKSFMTGGEVALIDAGVKLIAVETEDGIVLEPNDKGYRYFVTKGYEIDGELVGRKIGKNEGFSYTGVWGSMLLSARGIEMSSPKIADLLAAGVLVEHPTKKTKTVSTVKGLAYISELKLEDGTVVDSIQIDAAADGTPFYAQIFPIADIKTRTHESAVFEEEGEEDAE